MKLTPFFAISAALHVAGLFYPVRFMTHVHVELIPITVVAMDELAGRGSAAVAANSSESPFAPKAASKRNIAPNVSRSETTRAARIEEQSVTAAVRAEHLPAEPIVASINVPEEQLQPLQKPSSFNASGDAAPDLPPAGIAHGGGSGGSASSGKNGQGSGVGRYGSGSGFGSGSELSQSEPRFVPPRYRESPEPTYPESARREGKEGRVLLRVLVDQEGKAKIVEISSSSGSETLDRAAAQTIKRWRFFPARFGGKPVEHWVRFPIDFRLSNASQQ